MENAPAAPATPERPAAPAMRIALVCDYSLEYLGGAQSAFLDQVRIMRERGHAVTVIAPVRAGRGGTARGTAGDDGNVGTVGEASGLDDPRAVRDFLQRIPVAYPQAIDPPGPADAGVRLGNPKGVLPYSILVSADGRLLKQKIGPFEEGEIDGWVSP